MRRNLMRCLRAILIVCVFAFSAMPTFGYDVGDFSYSYSLSTKEATLTGYSGSSSHITIPTSFTVAETYKDEDGETHTRHHTITVTSIGSSAFANKTFITSVSFHNKLKSIGSSAFQGCTGLTSVRTSASLTSLGQYAFAGCTSLAEAEINGTGLDLYSQYAIFEGCGNLRRAVLGDGVTRLFCSYMSEAYGSNRRSGMFGYCTNLQHVAVGSGVTEVPPHFTTGCGNSMDGLSVSFAGRIGKVGYNAFNRNNITSLDITLVNCTVDSCAFSGCPAVTLGSVDFSQVKSVGQEAFRDCRNIVGGLDLPMAASIGSSAFQGCTGLTSVRTSASLTSLGQYAFAGCTSLAEAEINGTGLDLYSQYAIFEGCGNLQRAVLGDGVTRLFCSYMSEAYGSNRRSGMFGYCTNLQRDMADMKGALRNVRKNGINEVVMTSKDGEEILGDDGKAITKMTQVDSSLLDEMERLLADVSSQIADAKNLSVKRSRAAFLEEVKASLSPENAPGGDKVMSSGPALGNNILSAFRHVRKEFVVLIRDFAVGDLPMDQFDAKFDACIAKFGGISSDLESALMSVGFDEAASNGVAKTVKGLNVVKAQFRELMESSARLKDGGEDAGLATGDVRRIMLGEVGLSNVIEARSRGFKPGDVDPATEESNIASSRTLGSGAAGKTYLLTTKSGEEVVFKSELESRIGLGGLLLGMDGAYVDNQKAVNLNLATQDTAKAFGCEDVVVKYSVGSHDGQFGFFMEKAKGYTGSDFVDKKKKAGGNGISPADMYMAVPPGQEQIDIQGAIAKKLNKLMWLDLITGQGDRHWGNYFVNVEKNADNGDYDVTVKAIDNDASFNAWQIGLQKYVIDKDTVERFNNNLKSVCTSIHGREGDAEYRARVSKDPGIAKNGNGSLTIDFSKVESPEIKMAIVKTLGMQNVALPEEIDEDFYNKLMAMDRDPAKKQAYLDSIAPRISPAALKATENRLDEAIDHAKKLRTENKVYGEAQWKDHKNLRRMSGIEADVTIVKSDKKVVTVKHDIECVDDFLVRDCPSYYKRDYFQMMFKKPKPAA